MLRVTHLRTSHTFKEAGLWIKLHSPIMTKTFACASCEPCEIQSACVRFNPHACLRLVGLSWGALHWCAYFSIFIRTSPFRALMESRCEACASTFTAWSCTLLRTSLLLQNLICVTEKYIITPAITHTHTRQWPSKAFASNQENRVWGSRGLGLHFQGGERCGNSFLIFFDNIEHNIF